MEGKDDVVGSKIKKIKEYISSKLIENDFVISDQTFYFGMPSYLTFKIKNEPLSKIRKHYGPPKKFPEHLNAFKQKFQTEVFFEKNRSYVILKRQYTYAKDLIKDLLKDTYIKQKVKEIEFLA